MNQQMPYPPYPSQPPMQAQQMPQQQPVPQAYDPQQQTPPPAPEPAGKSGLAIAGLVLGIVAVATSFMPIINNASFFIGLVGLVLGIIGLVQTRKGTKSGTGLSVAAIILNVVACIAVLASQAFYSAAIDEAFSSAGITTSSSSAASQSASPQSSSAAQATSTSSMASEYDVTIDDATTTTDYSGNPALLVTYTWTNNSSDATSFAVALHAQCFQDGVECPLAVVSGADTNSMTQLKPGASTTVQQAYQISGTSDATVEVTKLISFDDTILAEKTFSIA